MRITEISKGKRIIHIQDNWKQLYFNNKMLQVKYESDKKTSILTEGNGIVKKLVRILTKK